MKKLMLRIALFFSAAALGLGWENYNDALAKKFRAHKYGMKK